MSDFDFVELNQLPTTPEFLCPFLAMLTDAETYSANLDFKNYCHKALPVAPVGVDHQTHICCTENYRNCIVYKATQPRSLPPEWANEQVDLPDPEKIRVGGWAYAGIILIGLLLMAFFYLYWFSGLFQQLNLNVAPITGSKDTLTQEASITATVIVSATPLQTPTLLPALEATKTDIPTFTQTPTLFLTATLFSPSPTQGPAFETPFGTQPLFVIHRVSSGESLSEIAAHFKTAAEVIEVVNNITADSIIIEGTVLVLMPGQTNPTRLPVVKAIFLTSATKVEDLAATYGVDVVEVRAFNGLGPDDWIQPNRWVVVRGK